MAKLQKLLIINSCPIVGAKIPGSESLAKLSQLQRLILVVLLEPRYERLSRRQFRDLVKRLYWGKAHALARGPSVAVSLSRAITRLEERGYIERFAPGGWRLTCPETDFVRNGWLFAILAWERAKELYALVGLSGPPVQRPPQNGAPGQEQLGAGVKVELHF
jgi:hypothetical protein